MLGYPVITAYYQVSVRLSLTLPSASFSQLLTKLTLPQLMDRSISAHEGLKPFTLTSCPAHINSKFIPIRVEDREEVRAEEIKSELITHLTHSPYKRVTIST